MNGHKEVCYEKGNCPVCEMIKEISDFEDEIYDLKETIDKLEKEV